MKKRILIFIQLMPVIVSLLVTGVHFLRSGNIFLMILSFIFTLCLFIREPLLARVIQFALFLATIEWLYSAFIFASARADADQPWARLVVIMGTVALISFSSIFVFYTKSLREMYHLKKCKN